MSKYKVLTGPNFSVIRDCHTATNVYHIVDDSILGSVVSLGEEGCWFVPKTSLLDLNTLRDIVSVMSFIEES